jgi:undecaprenyl-diphosphatase
MLSGVRRESAARFSFLLGIPAVVAAAVKEGAALRHLTTFTSDMGLAFLVGILVSGIVGYLSVRFLLRYLATHRLDVFAWYRLALAAAVWLWVG